MKKLLSAALLLLSLPTLMLQACVTSPVADTTDSETSPNYTTTESITTAKAETTAAPTIYYVRTPSQPAEPTLQTKVYTFDNYEEACALADDSATAALGYAVYGEDGTLLHGKYSQFVTELLYNAKHIADFMKENKYTYGSAATNPGVTYKKYLKKGKLSEKVASCDRYVGWVLYNMGYTDQPSDGGMYVWNNGSSHDLGTYLDKKGFQKLTDTKDFQAGDIVFVNLTHTAAGTPYPAHVFICAGSTDKKSYFYRYDAGSQNRIRCANQAGMGPDYTAYSESGQPFKEKITNLVYVYRYVGE